MKRVLVLLFIITASFSSLSQTYELGPFVGGSNYIGDVGSTSYIAPKKTVFGGVFKWNRSSRHAFRASVLFTNIEGDDAESNDERRQERGYSFENSITEASLGLEFNFWEWDIYSGRTVHTPYLYTGLTGFTYNAIFKSGNDEFREFDQAYSIAIPMVVGYKVMVNSNFILGMEIGARYTFTDALDGSYPVRGLKDNESVRFGNINSDDWYVFTGITLTIGFVRQPCYCNF